MADINPKPNLSALIARLNNRPVKTEDLPVLSTNPLTDAAANKLALKILSNGNRLVKQAAEELGVPESAISIPLQKWGGEDGPVKGDVDMETDSLEPMNHYTTRVDMGHFVDDSDLTPEENQSYWDAIERQMDRYEGSDDSYEWQDRTQGSYGIPAEKDSGLMLDFELDESQVAAVAHLTKEQYGCLIGAAGTGKTTVTREVIRELFYHDPNFIPRRIDATRLNIAMVAFTGMASHVIKKNMPEWLHGCCKTIHGLLEFFPEEFINSEGKTSRKFVPGRTELNKLNEDIIIVDEASMLGLELWEMLRVACKPGCRIYFIGDLNQLPPIVGQPVFAYALSQWPVSELTKVHRQKEVGANRIIEEAHNVLNGRAIKFDEPKDNPNWRVIGLELKNHDPKAKKKDITTRQAYEQILNIVTALRTKRVDASIDPETPLIYDPYRDRIMTAGNGFNEMDESSLVQQAPLNAALSQIIEPTTEEHPRFIIDAGRIKHTFAVNYRVMATKNEPPDMMNRVTNGLTGVITQISQNFDYTGDPLLVGNEETVKKYRREAIKDVQFGKAGIDSLPHLRPDASSLDDAMSDGEIEFLGGLDQSIKEEKGGQASHEVTVHFDNGAIRTYKSKPSVEALQLAYASTVAKCQGSQFDTAIIVVHHAQTGQLSREWLYTAVTRATKRVIILYTDFALRRALIKQKIFGATLAEKIQRYQQLMNEGVENVLAKNGRLRVDVNLYVDEY